MPLAEGVYDMTSAEYHADPCDEPSLSASTATTLLTKSPAHAFWNHPRLNPAFEREASEAFDLGTAAHAYVLEGERAFEVIDAEDWRTKAAKEARDAARAAGKVPLLRHRHADVVAMATTITDQLATFKDRPRPLEHGDAEQVLVWPEEVAIDGQFVDIWCRARLDFLHAAEVGVDDLKTTSASANPEAWSKGPLWAGPALQAAFYLRGLDAVFGKSRAGRFFRFVVVENYPPFALSVNALGPEALDVAERQVRMAVETWARCVSTKTWPAYPTRTCFANVPPWIEAATIQREESSL